MNYSLQARALLIASVVLALFLGATGFVLDRAFRASAEAVMRDRLEGYAEVLEAAIANEHLDGLKSLPETLAQRFAQPDSGLYAKLTRKLGYKLDWMSDSAKDKDIPWPPLPDLWTARLDPVEPPDGKPLYVLSQDFVYQTPKGRQIPYILQIAETLDDKESYYYQKMNLVRRDLWRWFGAAALLLLLLQAAILRRSFSPLRRVVADLRNIEAGRSDRLRGAYPRELGGLTENLNALLDQAESHLARYRNALGDLAHSLKTPLAVLQGALDQPAGDVAARALAREQIERMNLMIEYQLKRASASGRSHLAQPVSIREKARQIVSALGKVHAGRDIECALDIEPGLVFRGDEGDLLEILGNLADNAFKWARGRVDISARRQENGRLRLQVDDDGPGIPAPLADRLLGRGERGDPATPGHGLGLAIVHSIASAYGGRLSIGTSYLGGASVRIDDLE
jgi:two-component system sensor histidine kinase PhoQ